MDAKPDGTKIGADARARRGRRGSTMKKDHDTRSDGDDCARSTMPLCSREAFAASSWSATAPGFAASCVRRIWHLLPDACRAAGGRGVRVVRRGADRQAGRSGRGPPDRADRIGSGAPSDKETRPIRAAVGAGSCRRSGGPQPPFGAGLRPRRGRDRQVSTRPVRSGRSARRPPARETFGRADGGVGDPRRTGTAAAGPETRAEQGRPRPGRRPAPNTRPIRAVVGAGSCRRSGGVCSHRSGTGATSAQAPASVRTWRAHSMSSAFSRGLGLPS